MNNQTRIQNYHLQQKTQQQGQNNSQTDNKECPHNKDNPRKLQEQNGCGQIHSKGNAKGPTY